MIPLNSGMLNLSDGLKNWRVCAWEKGQKQENTKVTMITIISPDRTGPQCDAVKGATVVDVW
jgi:hypothetical protein